MKFSKLISILIFCLYCSCDSNNKNTTTNSTETSINSNTDKTQNRDIHEIDKAEYDEKIKQQRKIAPELLAIWNTFITVVTERNYLEFKKLSFDSVEACHTKYNIDKFIQKCIPEIFDTTLLKRFSEISYSNYLTTDIIAEVMPQSILKQLDPTKASLIFYQFQILKELTPDGGWTMVFDFVKTSSGYKFYSCDSFGGPICCF